ncbi:hypothetical protein M514_13219 [Trichuris suis]|uniref:Uncharacterized protein n=1 Tax=Trichuris suis TaxID=68888 RepID=A0A085LLR1_9BILA|nr:hypothetical protein M513_13219 [Trichuris suis]KFD63922.1 hypothetical protein M514_13219 [Trichuris suis]
MLCERVLISELMKPSRLKEHLTKSFTDGCKVWRAHTIGEQLLIPRVSEILRIEFHNSEPGTARKITLRKDNVESRIDQWPGRRRKGKLKAAARDESIFRIADHFFKEKAIPLKNITAAATAGAPSMAGSYGGFVSYLKEMMTQVMTVHWRHSPSTVSREAFESSFKRCFAIKMIWKLRQADTAHLTHLYENFVPVELRLEVGNLNLMKTKSVLPSFVSKLAFYKRNISRIPEGIRTEAVHDSCDYGIKRCTANTCKRSTRN